jgi:hypothetical protein
VSGVRRVAQRGGRGRPRGGMYMRCAVSPRHAPFSPRPLSPATPPPCRGAELAPKRLTQPLVLEGTTEFRDQYFNRGAADIAGPAPRPLDSLDGHLVMAHGTNITSRTPTADHYLTFTQAAFKQMKESQVLDGTVKGGVGRTDLMRAKAKLRAAGVDAWDPAPFRAVPTVPMTVTPSNAPAVGASARLGAGAAYATVASRTLGDASALSQSVRAQPDVSFARDGVFTKQFKTFLPTSSP